MKKILFILFLSIILGACNNKSSLVSVISPVVEQQTAPLPQEEDIIRSFFNLINEAKPSEAVMMMTSSITDNDAQKQAWGVQFNAISLIKVIAIEPSSQVEEWTDLEHTYKVTLDLKMKPESATAPIPYYGWDNGENLRWISIVKENNLWKIKSIATGP